MSGIAITYGVEKTFFYFSVGQQHKSGLGRFTVEVSRSHTIRHTHTVGFLWTSDQVVAKAYTTHYQTQDTNIYAVSGIRTHIPANERRQPMP